MKVLIVENQKTQYLAISECLDDCSVYPKKDEYDKFMERVAVWINKMYKEKHRNLAENYIVEYVGNGNFDLILMDYILGGPHHCLTGIDLAEMVNEKLDSLADKYNVLFLSAVEYGEKNRLERYNKYRESYPDTSDWLLKGYFGGEDIDDNYYRKNVLAKIKELVDKKKKKEKPIYKKIHWEKITPEDFEKLIYYLISEVKVYENPEWLTNTNAADGGRDLSFYKKIDDSLGLVNRLRVIIQCKKNKNNNSVNQSYISLLRDQIETIDNPRVDECIIATTGKFSNNAIQFIERWNQGDRRLKFKMWPENHILSLVNKYPEIIEKSGLQEFCEV